MAEVYLLETDVFIEPANTPIFLDTGVTEVLGYKNPETLAADGPYGGLSKDLVRDGVTGASTARAFFFDCITGARPDAEEGVRLQFTDPTDNAVVVTPFVEIIFRAGGSVGDAEYTMVLEGDQYRVADGTQNVEIEKWFRANLNNTPAITLKCYVSL